MKNYIKISFIVFTLFYLYHCAAIEEEAGAEQLKDDVLSTAEEKINNPLFDTHNSISLKSPTHDTIKTTETLVFELSLCGQYQTIVISSERILVDRGQIINAKEAFIGKKELNYYNKGRTFYLNDFKKIVNGKITSELLSLDAGRYYWASWSYSEDGELVCSSPQYSFFIR
ncbi:MAG: hypothetical protein OEZ22_12775 [Spirochaetia bacterium]|nr:hypothetical protein [Spirochaetia bacterium]